MCYESDCNTYEEFLSDENNNKYFKEYKNAFNKEEYFMESVNVIQCPHCRELIDYEDYVEVGDMEGEFDMTCECCGENFTVNFSTEIRFNTSK